MKANFFTHQYPFLDIMKNTITWIAASAIALLLSATWDMPSDMQAIEDVAAEVEELTGGSK